MTSKTEKGFELPGAENFTRYISDLVTSLVSRNAINLVKVKLENELVDVCILSSTGPEIIDRSYDMDYTKRWLIKLNDIVIGEYFTFGPKLGETDFGREYRGRIPGYENEAIVISNAGKPVSERIPEDSVSLVYANQRFENKDIHQGPGKLIDIPWQRQDYHDSIPFP